MINTVSSFYMLGVAEAEMLLQFPFLVREKGALIDRQSLSCISLPQVATGLRFACRARSVGGAFSRTTSWRPACAAGRTLRGALRADLLMPQEALFARGANSMQAAMRRALLRRGRSCKCCISTSIAASCVYRIIAVYVSNCCNACFII